MNSIQILILICLFVSLLTLIQDTPYFWPGDEEEITAKSLTTVEYFLKINLIPVVLDIKSQYAIIENKFIGEGSIGKVFLVKEASGSNEDMIYACKRINLNHYDLEILNDRLGHVLNEINVFKYQRQKIEETKDKAFFSKRHLMTILDIKADANLEAIYIIMDYIKGDTLDKALKQRDPKKIFNENPEAFLRTINKDEDSCLELLYQPASCIYDVIIAIESLHSFGIGHFDIKPSNIIIDSTDSCYLIDYSNSKAAQDNKGVKNMILGSLYYISPLQASFMDDSKKPFIFEYGRNEDFYSLGLTALSVFFGNPTDEIIERKTNLNSKDFKQYILNKYSKVMEKSKFMRGFFEEVLNDTNPHPLLRTAVNICYSYRKLFNNICKNGENLKTPS